MGKPFSSPVQILKLNFSVLLVFCLLGFSIYFKSLSYGYFLDDIHQIVNNKMIQDLSNWPNTFKFSTMAGAGAGGKEDMLGVYYKPIMMMTYSLLWRLKNGDPFPFHVMQLMLHILNSFLIFVLLKEFFLKENWHFPFVAGIVFLCHPINSEAVLFIADLQEPLYSFFGLSALLLFSKFQNNLSLAGVGLLLLCAVLSKESGLLYFLSAITYGILFQRKYVWQLMFSIFISAAVYLTLRFGMANLTMLHSDNTSLARADLITRLITMPRVLIHYIHLFIFPKHISLTQDWVVSEINFVAFWVPLFQVLLLVACFVFFLYRKFSKELLFFFLIFGFGWGLHSQLIPLDGTVSDRWFYFTIIGFTCFWLKILEAQIRIQRLTYILAFSIVTMFLSVRSYARSLNWSSELALYENDRAVDPDSFYLNNNLGLAYLAKSRFKEAIECFQKTVQVSVEQSDAWRTGIRNIGAVYLELKEFEKAEAYFRLVVNDGVRSARGYAGAFQGQRRYKELHIFLKDSLRKYPGDVDLLRIQNDIPRENELD